MRLFDLHCDTLYECYTTAQHLHMNSLQLDLRRGLRFDVWAQVFAVWMPDTLRGQPAFTQCCKILDFAHQQAKQYAEFLRLVTTPDDMQEAFNTHRCAGILAVEGGAALAGRLENLDTLADKGVKIITLTWNGSNELGHGVESDCAQGLTDFGKQAVMRMEQRGILPDVSHLNEAGFWDVLSCARGPVIASHSVAAGVHAHPRNLTDAQFTALRDRGGIVGLNLCEAQLGEQSWEALRRHWEHFLALDGAAVVALGCDLDGTSLPLAWDGIHALEQLYTYLHRKNYDAALIDNLFFGNSHRFFQNNLTNPSRVG